MWWAAAAQAASSLTSSLINNESQHEANRQNRQMFDSNQQYNMIEADKARRWNYEISNTAIRRQKDDMVAAGLNPILAVQGGGGAGGASSASASGPNAPTMQAPQIALPDMMAYYTSIKQLEQVDEKIAIDKANSAAGIARELSDADLKKAETMLKKKGLIRAELEGEAASQLQKFIRAIKKNMLSPAQPGKMEIPGQN